MAEGGHSRSLKESSDADFEISCTPCGEDDIREEAVKYCSECQEYLCTSCSKHHSRLKATRLHKLLGKDEAKTSSVIAKAKCRYHPDRDIEMYCGTHDMVYCTTCIATEHRSCGGKTRIEDLSNSCVESTEIMSLLDETSNAQESMRALTIAKQNSIASLGKQTEAVQEKIVEIATSLIEHIKLLEREMIDNLTNGYVKVKQELESEISVATHMMQELNRSSEQLQTISRIEAEQQFVQMKLTMKTVTDSNRLHANSKTNGAKAIHLTEDTNLISSILKSTALGKVHVETEDKKPSKPIQYKMNSKKEINIKVASDKSTCSISDVCQFSDGTILVTDDCNNRIKWLDTSYRIKYQFNLGASPRGICIIDKKTVALKMNNGRIQFLSVGTTFSKTRYIPVECGHFWGMAHCKGEIWISIENAVYVYNTTGTLIKSIDKYQNGNAIFKEVAQHMVVSGDTVIVTDQSDGAVCLNMDGTVRREMRDKRLKNACGVCVSDDGILFLCGYISNNIVMFISDGMCLGELVGADAGLKFPISMCYDVYQHSIIVTCEKSNAFHVIYLSKQ